MILYPLFQATRDDVLDLVGEQRLLRLVTIDESGAPCIGLHVFCHDDLVFEAHLVAADPQLSHLASGRPAVMEIDDTLSSIPHSFVDPDDILHADQFYRSVTVRGEACVIDDATSLAAHLTRIVARYQPEEAISIDANDPRVSGPISRLRLVRFTGQSFTSKFKLGQGSKPAALRSVIDALSRRGSSLDRKTAEQTERFLERRAPLA